MAITAVVTLVLACSHQPPARQLAQQAEPIGSWLATLQMTAEAWGANSVPAHFARDTTEAAQSAIESAAKTARESAAPPAVRDPLRRLLAEAHIDCRGFAATVERRDRAGAAAWAPRFHALGDRFAAWKAQAEAGQR